MSFTMHRNTQNTVKYFSTLINTKYIMKSSWRNTQTLHDKATETSRAPRLLNNICVAMSAATLKRITLNALFGESKGQHMNKWRSAKSCGRKWLCSSDKLTELGIHRSIRMHSGPHLLPDLTIIFDWWVNYTFRKEKYFHYFIVENICLSLRVAETFH